MMILARTDARAVEDSRRPAIARALQEAGADFS